MQVLIKIHDTNFSFPAKKEWARANN